MKNIKKLITVCVLCVSFVISAQEKGDAENSVLWKIEHPDLKQSSYLFGTLHMICEDEFSIPEKVLNSLNSVDELVLEVNLSDSEEMIALQKEMIKGNKISEDLTAKQFSDLDAFIQKVMGLPLQNFDAYGISTLYSMMTSKMLSCTNIKFMEIELAQIAAKKNVKVVALEKVSEQFGYIKMAYPPLECYRLIFLFEEYKEDFNKAVRLYKQEDITETTRLMSQDKYMNAHSRRYLLENRNINWVEKMVVMMKEKSNLFAVGAAHLTSKDGLIQLLKEKGYIVTPVL